MKPVLRNRIFPGCCVFIFCLPNMIHSTPPHLTVGSAFVMKSPTYFRICCLTTMSRRPDLHWAPFAPWSGIYDEGDTGWKEREGRSSRTADSKWACFLEVPNPWYRLDLDCLTLEVDVERNKRCFWFFWEAKVMVVWISPGWNKVVILFIHHSV